MDWVRKWNDEHAGDGGQQLSFRQVGKWEFSTWLSWTGWGLGVSAEREYGTLLWADRLYLNIELGPLTFAAVRTWNENW